MNIDQVKKYLKKAKDFREIGFKAIVRLTEYLKSEFEGVILIKTDIVDYIRLNCLGYEIKIETKIDWKNECPEILLKATNQKINGKNIFEEKTLVIYSIDKDEFVRNIDGSNVGHLDNKEKIFQEIFIADVISKIIETENIKGINPMEPGKTYAAGI